MSVETHISLDGEEFSVAKRGGDDTYRQRPQMRRDTEQLWDTWSMSSFHGGERLERILSEEDMRAARYDDGEGIDVSDWGQLKLQPALEETLDSGSTSFPMAVCNSGQTLVCGLSVSPYVKTWTLAGSWASSSGVTSGVTDIIVAGSALYAVSASGKVWTSANSGSTWSEVGSYSTAVGVAHLNDTLFILKSDGVYNHTNSESISSQGGTSIAAYRENLYWLADRRIWRYTGSGVYLYAEMPQGFVGTALIPYRMALLILGYYKVQGGYKSAVHYLLQGYENHLYSVGDYSGDCRIYAASGADDVAYIASPVRGGVDIYNLTDGGLSCGPATGTASTIPFKAVAYCDGYVFVGISADGVYYADVASPSTYVSTGWVTTPEYDFSMPYSPKVFKSVTIVHRHILPGESIIVEYSLDGGTDYEVLGTIGQGPDVASEFFFGNVRGNSIKLKLTINAGAGSVSTPTITEIRVQAAAVLETKWIWSMTLEAFSQYQGKEKIARIRELVQGQEIVKFIDMWGDEFNVMVDDIMIRTPPYDRYSALVDVVLKEV